MPESQTNHASPDRRAGKLRGLLVLNVLLLALLTAMTFGSSADAQGRVRGKYTMAAGGVNGSNSSAVYVVDVVNQELMAVTYNKNSKLLEGIGYRNLAFDAATRSSRR
jgi:hypothetical protein